MPLTGPRAGGAPKDRRMQGGSPQEPGPVVVSFDEAPGRITAAAAAAVAARGERGERGAAVVGITGPVGAGKSLLAARLSACVVSTDHFLPDYEAVPFAERDLPRHADLEGLAAALAALRQGRAADVPVWSFRTHRREGRRRVEPAALVVCEGIHALEGAVLPHLDVRVYVEAPAEVRWRRWEALERGGERGWGVEHAREYFQRVAEPTFATAADRYRRAAHVVVVNG